MKKIFLLIPVILLYKISFCQTLFKQLNPLVDSVLDKISTTGKIKIIVAPIRNVRAFEFQKNNITDAITEIVANNSKANKLYIAIPAENIEYSKEKIKNDAELSLFMSQSKKHDYLISTSLTLFENHFIIKLLLFDKNGEMQAFLSKRMQYTDEFSLEKSEPKKGQETIKIEKREETVKPERNSINRFEEPLPKMSTDCGKNDNGILILTNNTNLRVVVELKRQANPFNWSPEDRRFINLNIGERSIEICRSGNWSILVYDKQPFAYDNPFNVSSVSVIQCEFTKKSIFLNN